MRVFVILIFMCLAFSKISFDDRCQHFSLTVQFIIYFPLSQAGSRFTTHMCYGTRFICVYLNERCGCNVYRKNLGVN